MTRLQRDALDQMLRAVPLDLGGEVTEQRRIFTEMMSHIPPEPDVRTEEAMLGGVPVLHVAIDAISPRGTVLYFHGGAYAIGAAALAVGLASELGRRAGAHVISVDYSLAPEDP
jgi:acetyl esterase/lipase